ncbi:hypothetical protein Tco_0371623 [Tanacetum coccineum]
MTTLAEHIIVVGAENRPPMLEKSMYDSWASRIRLFIKGKKHGRMMLDSIDNGPLAYPTVEEDGQTRPKKYSKLTEAQQLQDECDVQATISFFTIYHPMYMHLLTIKRQPRIFRKDFSTTIDISSSVTQQPQAEFPQLDSGFAVPQFQQGEDPIKCINKFKEKLMLAKTQEADQILDDEQLAFLANPGISEAPVAQQTIPQNLTFQIEDLEAYDSDYDDLSSAKAVLMENLSSCDSDVLFEVPYFDSSPKDMINQDVQEMSYSEQTHDTNSSAPNDLLILSLVEQMTNHLANLDKENQTYKMEIDTLKETLSTHVKEKESLAKTLTVFKTESKEKESKYIDKEIVLEKQNKELENIICKMYRSTQAMHMLTKPQVFYDDTHKQALGYQNPFNLKKAQWIKPTLYDGSVTVKEHVVISVIDDEETLILE